jgi:hypothetical protein
MNSASALPPMENSEPKFNSHFMGAKASNGVGLKSAQVWGCPMSMHHKCLFKDVRRDLLHSTPFPLQWGWIADYGVDYEMGYNKSFFEYSL